MQKLLVVAFFIACFFQTITGNAQNDTLVPAPKIVEKKPILCKINMQDGSVYFGFIEKQTDSLLYVKSGSGVLIHVPKKQVASINFLDGHVTTDSTGNLTIHIPSISHKYYVFSSNAFLFKAKEVYGSSVDFAFYNINYSITRNVSLGVSTSVVFAPIFLQLKTNFEIAHKLFLGFDGTYGTGSWASPKSYGGGALAKITYGDNKFNFTVSGGYGDIDYYVQARPGRRGGRSGVSHYENLNSAIVGAAFSYGISKKFYFVTEFVAAPNIYIAGVTNPRSSTQLGIYSLSPAIRTNLKHNISWVIGANGFVTSATNRLGTTTTVFALPYVGFSFKF